MQCIRRSVNMVAKAGGIRCAASAQLNGAAVAMDKWRSLLAHKLFWEVAGLTAVSASSVSNNNKENALGSVKGLHRQGQ